jgi:hypothetical protein
VALKPALERRNRKKLMARRQGRTFACGDPVGRKVLSDLVSPLSALVKSEVVSPPKFLKESVCQLLSPEKIALCALVPLLNCIARPRLRGRRLTIQQIEMRMGRHLRDLIEHERLLESKSKAARIFARAIRKRRTPRWFLRSDWTEEETQRAGFWLLQCALKMEYFGHDEDFYPVIHPVWQAHFDAIAKEIRERDQSFRPLLMRPPDWIGWRTKYPNGQKETFIRSWRPGVKEAITAAFRDPDFEHPKGVNALQRVPLVIDRWTRDLVERHALKLLNRKVDNARPAKSEWEWKKKQLQRTENHRLVQADLLDADWIGDRTFWLHHNCDRRGRVYPIPHFHYQREDHVRSLFRFRNPLPLGSDGESWLQIHSANCGGFDGVDKASLEDRVDWVNENRRRIERVARDPDDTINHWCEADQPFAYLAACRELDRAWAGHPERFESNLPIALDCTCNGIQHLALLTGDAEAGRMVNLTDDPKRFDVYTEVAAHVESLIKHTDHPHALWWRQQFEKLGDKRRKLAKPPVMTFSYNVTDGKMRLQIFSEWDDQIGGGYPKGAMNYLMGKFRASCKELLRGPADAMDYITALAQRQKDKNKGEFLEWTSPTGLPISNRYYVSNVETIYLFADGHDVKRRVADGETQEIHDKAVTSAAANYIHSMDAAHLMFVAIACAKERIDLLAVHDSYSCLAARATRLNEIIRAEMVGLYGYSDPLAELGLRNGGDAPPKSGDLDPFQILRSKYFVT